MHVTRNVLLNPRLVPGGGAAEMALAHVRINYYVYSFKLQQHSIHYVELDLTLVKVSDIIDIILPPRYFIY